MISFLGLVCAALLFFSTCVSLLIPALRGLCRKVEKWKGKGRKQKKVEWRSRKMGWKTQKIPKGMGGRQWPSGFIGIDLQEVPTLLTRAEFDGKSLSVPLVSASLRVC